MLSEKEKSQKGLLYEVNSGEELVNDRLEAKDICFEYNNTLPSQVEKKINEDDL